MKLYDTLLDAAFWHKVRNDPAYAAVLEDADRELREIMAQPPIIFSFAMRNRYYVDGNRAEFDGAYLRQRIRLANAALLALVYPERSEYLTDVENTLWAICDEYSWAFPAHCSGEYTDDTTMVDLFAAETGAMVAEITAFLQDRLHERVFLRARAELKKRVFDNFRSRYFGWETAHTNWSAVCSGGIGIAMIYAAPELVEEFLPRLLAAQRDCLDSYTEDGVCLEGMTYWGYGFGYFVYFADLLYRFTDGRIDLFDDPHVELTAKFPQCNLMLGNTATSYADGNMYAKISIQLYHFLYRRYPDTVCLPLSERMEFDRGNCRWVQLLRYFAYFDPTLQGAELPQTTALFPAAGQYITTRETYSFAVKAGHNDEPHNHNDVGSFILSARDGQELCDLGAGAYTRQYFGAERYTIFCNSSASHSVPIINGFFQHEGRTYAGTIQAEGDTVTLEIGGAYPTDVGNITRSFTLCDRSVCLTDTFTERVTSFTERFVSLIKPTVTADSVRFKHCTLHFDAERMKPTVTAEVHIAHHEERVTVYCVDFAVDPSQRAATFTFEI